MESDLSTSLTAVSFNMDGFHQGSPVLDDLISHKDPDVIQETGTLAYAYKTVSI